MREYTAYFPNVKGFAAYSTWQLIHVTLVCRNTQEEGFMA